ncbi:IS481 family transposase [Stenotrophomonas acidaminiphila]|nr:IS481 family transposase [Stenotrophomonas acidaminiphila]
MSVAPSTIARLLRRAGLHRLAELEPALPENRYEHARPGQLLHLDIKKLGRIGSPGHRVTGDRSHRHRGIGWEYVHLAIDDHSRVAFASIEPDERETSACKALIRTVRYYRSLGVCFERVLTDNGTCYRSRRFQRLLRRLGMRHLRTRPYTPRTNGKAERLVQTSLREWAYARAYDNSGQRAGALHDWLHHYNWHRPHASLGYKPPISRIPLNNVLGLHS